VGNNVSGGRTFGALLRDYRSAANITQEELAERSGISVQAIGALERGVRRAPRPSTIEFLAGALKLDSSQHAALVAAARGGRRDRDAEPGPAAATRTLPRDVASFTGRVRELNDLLTAVSPGRLSGRTMAVHAIDGMAGVGKTAFAVHAAHRLAPQFPDGQLFLELHAHTAGQRPVSPMDALERLLLTTGVAAQLIPRDLDARAAMWRDRLVGRRMLILLDDAAGHEQVRPLLPSAPGCLTLITSRRRLVVLEDVETVTLGTLPPVEAARLFTRLSGSGRQVDPGAVAEVVELCGHLPLAIGLLARRLRSHASWTVGYLVELVTQARSRIAEMQVDSSAVSVAFNLTYQGLPPARQRLFRRLALHPGREIDAYAAAALDGIDVHEARRQLDALYYDHLVDEPTPGRYRQHDLIREYARTLIEADDHSDRDRAVDRLLDYYQVATGAARRPITQRADATTPDVVLVAEIPNLSTVRRALAWLESEWANLDACLDHAADCGRDARTVRLAQSMHPYLRVAGHWHRALAVQQTAVAAARLGGDPTALASALSDLGDAHSLVGEYPDATAHLTEALTLFASLGDRLGMARALCDLAYVGSMTGAHLDAIARLREALATYRELDSGLGQANALWLLGRALRMTGDVPAATACLAEALGRFQDLDNLLGQANTLGALADVQRMAGDYLAAAASLTEAMRVFRDLGNRLGQFHALHTLGNVQRLVGNYPAAAAATTEASLLCRELGHRHGHAAAVTDLGRLRYLTGDYPGAAALLSEGMTTFRALGLWGNQANALMHLGHVQCLSGDHPAAATSLTEALAMFRESGTRHSQATALEYLGIVQRLTGEPRLAAASLAEALLIFREVGDRHGQAEALNNLGRLHLDCSRREEAVAEHRQALLLARQVGTPLEEARALEGAGRCLLGGADSAGGAAQLRQALAIYQRLGAPEVEHVREALAEVEGAVSPTGD
jgi:tetratricopeptide (TPR) repeat protein/transcriptional regulator with XRE-family HTH domain